MSCAIKMMVLRFNNNINVCLSVNKFGTCTVDDMRRARFKTLSTHELSHIPHFNGHLCWREFGIMLTLLACVFMAFLLF